MIFVHIEEKNKKIKMVSIPRDLFYNGRKINAFAGMYGLPELKKTLSEISGYKLDKYIVLEMFAFIDVVDLIGGIDVHLSKALVDPTYVVIDNGVKGTLNYAPGDYHLGGKEALRIARSRHTSSDFARAERQQLILKALQTKAKNLGFSDTTTIYEIIKTVLARTETDISLDEAVAYFFKYQNYEIVSNAVISSGNILYTPPYIEEGNCNSMIAAATKAGTPIPDCSNANHAYTLVPKDDNWDLIKWFFQGQFN
jgi:LCP family protein required for cell wall assembly